MRMIPLVPALVLLCGVLSGPADAAEPPRGWLREWPVTDFSRSAVAFSEILSGGPPRDGIPAIDAPQFETADSMAAPPAPIEPVEAGPGLRPRCGMDRGGAGCRDRDGRADATGRDRRARCL